MDILELLNRLSLPDLIQTQVIPDIFKVAPKETKRHPKWYYEMTKNYPLESRRNCNAAFELWFFRHFQSQSGIKVVGETLDLIYVLQEIGLPEPTEISWLDKSQDWLRQQLKKISKTLDLWQDVVPKLNQKLEYKNIEATLRCQMEDLVLDYRVCGNFVQNSEESLIGILSAFSFLRAQGHRVDYLGWILPLQQQVFIVDLTEWDHTLFLDHLTTIKSQPAPKITDGVAALGDSYSSTAYNQPLSVLQTHFRVRGLTPCQIFLHDSKGSGTITKQNIMDCHNFIQQQPLPLFVHSPYIINLSNSWIRSEIKTVSDRPKLSWFLDLLKKELSALDQIGGQGVVVHVGKANKAPEPEAVQEMEYTIREVLDSATPGCPLLLETPAGQGTETLTKIEDFIAFTNKFQDDPRFGVCIDSAHIFACGYDPLDYVQEFTRECPGKLKLFHFNDSREPRGSRKDRHAPMGKGYIGQKRMEELADWLYQNQVPVVIEYKR